MAGDGARSPHFQAECVRSGLITIKVCGAYRVQLKKLQDPLPQRTARHQAQRPLELPMGCLFLPPQADGNPPQNPPEALSKGLFNFVESPARASHPFLAVWFRLGLGMRVTHRHQSHLYLLARASQMTSPFHSFFHFRLSSIHQECSCIFLMMMSLHPC